MVDVVRTFYKQVNVKEDVVEREAEFIFSNFQIKDYRSVVRFIKKYRFKDFLEEIKEEFKYKTILKIKFLIKIEHKEAKCFDKNIKLFFKEKITIEDKENTIYEIKTYDKYCGSFIGEERSFSDEEGYFSEEDNLNEYKDFIVIANVKTKSYLN